MYHQALAQERHELLYKLKPSQSSDNTPRCILTFSHQYKEIRTIIQKYRRCMSLKDTLVNSHYVGQNTVPAQLSLGTFFCGGCDACESLDNHMRATLPTGVKWH